MLITFLLLIFVVTKGMKWCRYGNVIRCVIEEENNYTSCNNLATNNSITYDKFDTSITTFHCEIRTNLVLENPPRNLTSMLFSPSNSTFLFTLIAPTQTQTKVVLTTSTVNCDVTCSTCNGPTSSDCLTCYKYGKMTQTPPNRCEYCLHCDNGCTQYSGGGFYCRLCDKGYHLSVDGVCELHVNRGDTNNQTMKGVICPEGQYVDVNNVCQDCYYDCKTCNSSTKCLKCKESNKALINGICYYCPSACATCYGRNNGECTSCTSGYYLKDDYCKECTSNCSYGCNKVGNVCTECLTGSFVNETGSCISCTEISNCDAEGCQNGQTKYCENCINGFESVKGVCVCPNETFQYSQNKCKWCTYGCNTCTGENANQCTSCLNKYFLANNSCIKCNKNCVSGCDDGVTKCKTCSIGYYVLNGVCVSCTTIQNCDTKGCDTGDTPYCNICANGFVATKGICVCPEGHYINSQNVCRLCYEDENNCKTCGIQSNNTMKCTQCYSPFVLTSSGHCQNCQSYEFFNKTTLKCAFNDENCKSNIKEDVCIGCSDMAFLSENKCLTPSGECSLVSLSNCEMCNNGVTVGTLCSKTVESCKYYKETKDNIKCLQCNDSAFFDIKTTKCNILVNNVTYRNNHMYKCGVNEYKNEEDSCLSCGEFNSKKCYHMSNKTIQILSCQEGYIYDYNNNICEAPVNCKLKAGNDCLSCTEFNMNMTTNKCHLCELVDHCIIYKNDCTCYNCSSGYLLDKNQCISIEKLHCEISNEFNCVKCVNGYIRNTLNDINNLNEENTAYCQQQKNNIKYSKYDLKGEINIFECIKNYFLFNQTCEEQLAQNSVLKTNENLECRIQSSKGCISCQEGYFNDHNSCFKCENNCQTCSNKTHCLTCDRSNNMLLTSEHTCEESTLSLKCLQPMAGNVGCAICRDGYYYKDKDCIKCDKSCSTCKNGISCLKCSLNYFYDIEENLLCNSYDSLIQCKEKTQEGCVQCNEGYYIKTPYCEKCPQNCTSCVSSTQCVTCIENYVMINNKCLYHSTIEFCIKSKNNICTKCNQNHRPSDDGMMCLVDYFVIIGVPIIVTTIVIFIIIIVIVVLIYFLQKRRKEIEKRDVCVFKMNKSNLIFHSITKELCSNKKVMVFEGKDESCEIEVNKESRELICLGNTTSHRLKIQMKVKEGNDVYEIRSEPPLISLKPHFACEFEIFLKPNFSTKIEDTIACVTLDLVEGTQKVVYINIKATTKMSTRLDYHELREEKKIGEGSFGIVYKGFYRENCVVIKMMKNSTQIERGVSEFEKEIEMLDKFRCEYIIYFYGAVVIPNKMCMVTEFAQFGSLQNFIYSHKSNSNTINMKMKIKLMLDASKGILYLHENGILHRDIKPDNILVFSLDTIDKVNAKLTDFGSSRNINLLMTNMTFTKGIGTPVYMAPEVLNQEKYKKSADVYSFGVTLYEAFSMSEAFPIEQFPFPWKIAEFVTAGNRLKKTDIITTNEYELITRCWAHNQNDRPTINEVVDDITTLFASY
ncbi:protein serine/threonine kinase, putative [Entamoeba invadens IP1]|uniref:Protein serine/threonine kinase, putative n=1 Tax=Entamoeba invadens IP1 TaxID=370355 RepID=L7FLB6_ENTIV|nr:protein serine/threonine kinase, putative [Entamoeba invadens IP1]ELP83940.1 protein serine/threonine kinase, putative [Entamoeba invadens IP1]|eukprot:XP_004183286.1 protein serine/threonine kinase, putative [Entamoeba invadens IP1]